MKNLGKLGRDKITGVEGVIVGKIFFLFGCAQYGISPKIEKPGEEAKTYWLDEKRIEILGPGVKKKEVRAKKPGGSNIDAPGYRGP